MTTLNSSSWIWKNVYLPLKVTDTRLRYTPFHIQGFFYRRFDLHEKILVFIHASSFWACIRFCVVSLYWYSEMYSLRVCVTTTHWAHDVVATLNQRHWRWFKSQQRRVPSGKCTGSGEKSDTYFLCYYTTNSRGWPNARLMLGQRRRRWPYIKPALVDRHVFCWVQIVR